MSDAIDNLMDTPSDVLRAWLLSPSSTAFALPSSQEAGIPLYCSAMPDGDGERDEAACLYDTTGILHGRLLASGTQPQSYGIQLKLRSGLQSGGYKAVFTLARTTAKQLSRVKWQLVNVGGNQYTIDTVRQTSSVISLGQDERRRAMCSVNFLLMLINA